MNTPIYESELDPSERELRAAARRKAAKIATAAGFVMTPRAGYWTHPDLCPFTEFFLSGAHPIRSLKQLLDVVFQQGIENGRRKQAGKMRESLGL